MPRKHRIMPISLQIYNLKRIFQSLNSHLEDPQATMDEIDWEIIDSTCSFPENLEEFEQNYPQYYWKMWKKKKSLRNMRPKWQSRIDSKGKCLISSTKVTIKPHKVEAKNKSYLHGRIQVTVDRKWIGRKATIIVRIPVHNQGLDVKCS